VVFSFINLLFYLIVFAFTGLFMSHAASPTQTFSIRVGDSPYATTTRQAHPFLVKIECPASLPATKVDQLLGWRVTEVLRVATMYHPDSNHVRVNLPIIQNEVDAVLRRAALDAQLAQPAEEPARAAAAAPVENLSFATSAQRFAVLEAENTVLKAQVAKLTALLAKSGIQQ
jgi:hypothetical protein